MSDNEETSNSETVNKVMYFLERVKVNPVQEEQPQEAQVPANLNIRNYNFTLNAFYLFLSTIIVIVAFIGAVYMVSFYNPHKALPIVGAPHFTNIISQEEAQNYKNTVHAIAKCENKHYNAIYAELRKKFNYVRYRDLDKETYAQALLYLKPRICTGLKTDTK